MSIVSSARVLLVDMFCDFTGRPLQNDHAIDRQHFQKAWLDANRCARMYMVKSAAPSQLIPVISVFELCSMHQFQL